MSWEAPAISCCVSAVWHAHLSACRQGCLTAAAAAAPSTFHTVSIAIWGFSLSQVHNNAYRGRAWPIACWAMTTDDCAVPLSSFMGSPLCVCVCSAIHPCCSCICVCVVRRASSSHTQTNMTQMRGSALVSVLVRGICQPSPATSRGPFAPFILIWQKPGLVSLLLKTLRKPCQPALDF